MINRHFIPFLEQYMKIGEQEDAEAKHQTIVVASRKAVQAALDQEAIGKIGRVFNDFPLQFTPPRRNNIDPMGVCSSSLSSSIKTYYAIDPNKFDEFVRSAVEAVKGAGLEPKSAVIEKAGIKKECEYIEFSDGKAQQAVNNLVDKLLLLSCKELLTPQGELEQEIVDLLGLEKLRAKFKTKLDMLEQIKLQVIISYSTQIILACMIQPMHAHQLDYMKISLLQRYIMSILNDYMPALVNGEEKLEYRLTPYFKAKIPEYIEARRSSIYVRCADELMKMSFTNVSQIVKDDLQRCSLVKFSEVRFRDAYLQHKLEFWVNVLSYFKQISTNHPNTARIKSIMMGIVNEFDLIERDVNRLPNSRTLGSYPSCLKMLSQLRVNTSSAVDVFEDKRDMDFQGLQSIFAESDNVFLFTQLRKFLADQTQKFAHIFILESNIEYMQKSPAYVCDAVFMALQPLTSSVTEFVKEFQNAKARENFLIELQSQVKKLTALRSVLPAKLLSILNDFCSSADRSVQDITKALSYSPRDFSSFCDKFRGTYIQVLVSLIKELDDHIHRSTILEKQVNNADIKDKVDEYQALKLALTPDKYMHLGESAFTEQLIILQSMTTVFCEAFPKAANFFMSRGVERPPSLFPPSPSPLGAPALLSHSSAQAVKIAKP